MSDLISRKMAVDAIHEDADWLAAQGSDWQEERMERDKSILMSLPSAEPKTPSNGSITCVKSEKMHDRPTDDLISRQDVLHELDGCDYELKDWQRWKLKTMVRDIPSAEKAQLSGEDATKDATSDLISRKELLKQIDIDSDGERGYYGDNWKFIDTIESMPSAEPEVIRCRDCKHHDGIRCFRWNSTIITGFDDFCSNAEKRGEEDE